MGSMQSWELGGAQQSANEVNNWLAQETGAKGKYKVDREKFKELYDLQNRTALKDLTDTQKQDMPEWKALWEESQNDGGEWWLFSALQSKHVIIMDDARIQQLKNEF